jgi:IS605 OrfB family transposase
MQPTYQYRVKDKHAARLNAQARTGNFVWNYCNETQMKAARDGRKWLSGYDLWKLVAGATKEGLDLHSHSAMRLCLQYDKSVRQHNKPWLKWRSSRRSPGWVPFNTGHVVFRDGGFVFRGERYDVFLHRPLPEGAKIGAGSFAQDKRGRWYINCPVEVAEAVVAPNAVVGIDLGLESLATLSTGEKIETPRFYRKSEERLAKTYRARKTRRVRNIHARIANRRKDFLHKQTTKLAERYGFVAVGDVSASKLAQTSMAKSVLDAGWSRFKNMLSWKLRLRSGGMLLEVSEYLTTQTCSECGSLPASRPKGNAGRGIREWICDDCGSVHDRDVNAAKNILRIGLDTLAEGASHEAGKPRPSGRGAVTIRGLGVLLAGLAGFGMRAVAAIPESQRTSDEL